MVTESGEILTTEGGIFLQSESGGLDISLRVDWQKQIIDLTGLINVKKIRITFILNESMTIYFDRFDIFTNSWFKNEIILDEVTYSMSRSNILADCTFGEKPESVIKTIKKLDDKQESIINIFQKG